MKIKSSIVVAVAAAGSASVMTGSAQAQVPGSGAQSSPSWSWSGFYVGGHLGGAWQKAHTLGSYFDGATQFPFDNSTSRTGFIGGGQIGYNWQSGRMVYGLEADLSGMSGSTTATSLVSTLPVTMTSTNAITGMGSVRGRIGATVTSNILAYATAGVAFARVKNDHTESFPGTVATWQNDETRTGFIWGGGIEAMLAPQWSVRLEGMYVDFGKKTLNTPTTGTCLVTCQPVEFSNKLTTIRLGVNYRFQPGH